MPAVTPKACLRHDAANAARAQTIGDAGRANAWREAKRAGSGTAATAPGV